MKITLLGASGGEVTGSAYLVETQRARLLVDFGMFQGSRQTEALNRLPAACQPRRLDAVLVTHAHLDHTGRLPLLVRNGYRGPIYTTPATADLARLILTDSARLQVQDAARLNRKRERAGLQPVSPPYEALHVEQACDLMRPVSFHDSVDVAEGISAYWVEAGHLLGSASIRLTVEEGDRRRVVVFSGDLGPPNLPIVQDAEPFAEADVVFLESTYGDRDHRPYDETVAEFAGIVKEAAEHRGKLLVPTFAVGRAQQMVYHLAVLFHQGAVPRFPVYLDSPMAIEASRIYREHPELLDREMQDFRKQGVFPADPSHFRTSPTADDSRALNELEGPCLILAGSGMCAGGRILHHLKQNLWRDSTHVLIVGYPSRGSLGRQIVEGVPKVKIHGESIAVRAQVHTLGGFSAHAGQRDLLAWFGVMAASQPRTVLVHGEDGPRQALAALITERHGIEPQLPGLGEELEF